MDALFHPYLEEGRLRYHSFLCTCCPPAFGSPSTRQFCPELEPMAQTALDFSYEKDLLSVAEAKGRSITTIAIYKKLMVLDQRL